jgi:aspartokinase/homoserine dehydrogenase 1
MKVLKFGGSSVKDAEKICHVVSIIQEQARGGRICVVLSAMRGITDDLINAARIAEAGGRGYKEIIADIRARQVKAAQVLFEEPVREKALGPLLAMCDEAGDILHGIELVKECSARSLDLVMSFGERLNCRLMADYMRSVGLEAGYFDARSVIVTDDRHGNAVVDFRKSFANIRRKLGKCKEIAIVTGFIAATPEGVTTTLGRNGSDYTASIIAAGLGAESVEIWKDVDGVLSADPSSVPEAFVIDEVSYEEAMEMSFFGAEVIHPYTMIPAVEKDIPLWIKNTLNPSVRGTLIAREIKRHPHPITSIASIEKVALINVEGGGMVGIPGVASRVFSALAKAGVNIIMISQASSEHSICIVCREEQAKKALAGLKTELTREIQGKQIGNFELIKNLEIVAIIGENMRGTPGISGRLFSALGDGGINVLAIAQGSSERNISFVIEGKDREKALNTVHRAFFGAKPGKKAGKK